MENDYALELDELEATLVWVGNKLLEGKISLTEKILLSEFEKQLNAAVETLTTLAKMKG